MRFSVEPWSPEFGSPFEESEIDAANPTKIDFEVEIPRSRWEPVGSMGLHATRPIRFVDGVRRIEARVWLYPSQGELEEPTGSIAAKKMPVLGLCASCAAGIIECNTSAEILHCETRRFLVAPLVQESIRTNHCEYVPEVVVSDTISDLMNGLANALSATEAQVASAVRSDSLLVLDGPLRGRERIPNALGYIKSHHRPYLEDELVGILASLAPGERTPIFFIEQRWSRYSWYLRLPGGEGHPWSGMVRLEAPNTMAVPEVIATANATCATLPGLASEAHKDGRAPQNLYPIKGLEDHLRRRLGDSEFLFRSIKLASRS